MTKRTMSFVIIGAKISDAHKTMNYYLIIIDNREQ